MFEIRTLFYSLSHSDDDISNDLKLVSKNTVTNTMLHTCNVSSACQSCSAVMSAKVATE